MGFIEYKKGDLVDSSIEITGHKEGGLGQVYFGYCRQRQIRVVIKTFRRMVWEEYELASKWRDVKDDLTSARLPSRNIDVGEYIFFTFFREARLICQSRSHPSVIKGMRFWWTEEGQPFFECEFIEESQDIYTLCQRARLRHSRDPPFSNINNLFPNNNNRKILPLSSKEDASHTLPQHHR